MYADRIYKIYRIGFLKYWDKSRKTRLLPPNGSFESVKYFKIGGKRRISVAQTKRFFQKNKTNRR